MSDGKAGAEAYYGISCATSTWRLYDWVIPQRAAADNPAQTQVAATG